jgi:sterol desaturase/sphingolipid hydroxylase (fatty acid hydroxylase superfamily)
MKFLVFDWLFPFVILAIDFLSIRCFRYLSGAVNHDAHHSANIGNFGMFWFWDWVLETRTSDARKAMQSKSK